MNERFGVVNVIKREKYEREFQVPCGYDFISFNKIEAITHCRRMNDGAYITERIFDTASAVNNKQEIFRSGSFKEGENEKDN